MTESGTQATEVDSIPEPGIGAGSAELTTETHDVSELRELLVRARERLSFYESFDKIIGENVKRSGELMLETIQFRELADAASREAAQAKAEFSRRLNTERQRHRELLGGLSFELDDLHSRLESFREKLQTTISAIDSSTDLESSTAPSTSTPASATSRPVQNTAPAPIAAPSNGSSKTIDVLFHGIPDPGIALQLQRHLSDVDSVSNVEAREFAEGILRLQVTSNRPLISTDFSTWHGANPIRILREQSNVIEATLAET